MEDERNCEDCRFILHDPTEVPCFGCLIESTQGNWHPCWMPEEPEK